MGPWCIFSEVLDGKYLGFDVVCHSPFLVKINVKKKLYGRAIKK